MKIIKQKGVSLLEVLISVLVLSVGLLGLGGLQLYALKGSNNAHFRTTASILASDLSDRIRINSEGVALGSYEFSESQSISICENKNIKLCTGSNTCSATELANFDLYQIACGMVNNSNKSLGMKNLLPSATLSVNCGDVSCNRNIEHIITIKWKQTDNHDKSDDTQIRTLVWSILP
jgi:type IV pilus assembly protein PilV